MRRWRPGGRAVPWFVTGLGLPLLSMGFLIPDAGYQDALRLDRALTEIRPVFTLPLLFNSADLISAGSFGNPELAADASQPLTLKVRRGDTLDRLFRRQGLDLGQLQSILRLDTARDNLRILKPGDQISVRQNRAASWRSPAGSTPSRRSA